MVLQRCAVVAVRGNPRSRVRPACRIAAGRPASLPPSASARFLHGRTRNDPRRGRRRNRRRDETSAGAEREERVRAAPWRGAPRRHAGPQGARRCADPDAGTAWDRNRPAKGDAFRIRRAAIRRSQRSAAVVLGRPLQRGRLELLGCIRVLRRPQEQVGDRQIAGHRNMPVPRRIRRRPEARMRRRELQRVDHADRLVAHPLCEAHRLLWIVSLPGAEILGSERIFVRPGEEGFRRRVRPGWPMRASRDGEHSDDEPAHDQLPVVARRPAGIRRSGSSEAMRPSVATAASIRGDQTTPELSRMQLS